ncbi:MAG: amidase [Pseudomonadota bacterium]|nr:amidase [Pseudomonadota bacterium]
MARLNNKIKDPINCFVPHSPPIIKGSASGPLNGLTFTVKDLYDIANHKTGNGSPAWLESHEPAANTASIVQSCLNAGATMIGKVICDEFFYSFIGENAHYGTPVNSAAPSKIPGGSSSGSAASVAGRICDFSLGSDTGGSVRIPAAFCGLYGLRPTYGRLSLEGATPMAPSFDTAGWFARDLNVFSKVGHVLLDQHPTTVEIKEVRLAEFAFNLADDEISIPLRKWIELNQFNITVGEPVTHLPEKIELDEAREAFRIIQAWEVWQTFGSWIERTKPSLGPGVKERMDIAKTVTTDERDNKIFYKKMVATVLQKTIPEGTILALPVTASLPVDVNTDPEILNTYRAKTLSLICLASLSGLPQISIPVTKSNGIPVSLGLIGWKGSDEALISMASRLAHR